MYGYNINKGKSVGGNMELKEKLEILIKRNGYKKTDFASAVSITYRALANYISGARTPRPKTLSDMAVLLGISEEILTDVNIDIALSSDEKLYFYGTSSEETREKADDILSQVSEMLCDENFSEDDKTAFFSCIAEKYFSEKAKKQKEPVDKTE